MNNVEKILSKLGLSSSEQRVYLAGLKSGQTTASILAKRSGLTRPTVYQALEQLEDRGLVSKAGPKHGQRFSMETHSRLKELVERKKMELEKIGTQLDLVQAEFESLYATYSKPPRIHFYQGVEGMKNVGLDILNTKTKEIKTMVAIEKATQIFDETYLEHFQNERRKRKIKSRGIWNRPSLEYYREFDLQEIRVNPPGYTFESTIMIYDDKVAVISTPNELFAFVIQSQEFVNTMTVLFESLWKQSSPIAKKAKS